MVYRPFNKMEEAIALLPGYSSGQQISSKNPNNSNNIPFISSRKYLSNHVLPPSHNYFHSILQPPPHYANILSRSSYPPPPSAQLPPLLPLPTTAAHHHGAAATINRGLSFPPTPPKKKPTKGKKKSKPPSKKNTPKVDDNVAAKVSSPFISSPSSETKPTRNNKTCGNKSGNIGSRADDNGCFTSTVKFSGAEAFAISPPPPSSLPLPSFSLRPKVNCKEDARGGATDDLRKILRLT